MTSDGRPRVAVLDASIAAPWFLPDEASDAADRVYASLRRGSLNFHAPELWLWECGNILASALKRRRLVAGDALTAWNAVDAVRGRLTFADVQTDHVADALRLALMHGLSIYDAAYLRLAIELRLPLCTADRALGRAAEAAGVHALTLEDLV